MKLRRCLIRLLLVCPVMRRASAESLFDACLKNAAGRHVDEPTRTPLQYRLAVAGDVGAAGVASSRR
jgi:hypothetical protein